MVVDLHGDLHETLRALYEQGPPAQLEIVLVTPNGNAVSSRYPELAGFGAVIVVSIRRPYTTATAQAVGFRAARGPVVMYCEDHAFPEPGSIEARLAAHAAGATIVGAALRNANPATTVSRAHFLQHFGPFATPVAGGRTANLPWHQTSYRREVLPMGPELEPLLENEGLLHAELRRAGHTLVLEPAVVTAHLSPSRLGSLLCAAWYGGRVWGAGRAVHGDWSLARRVAHASLFPPIALRQLRVRLIDAHRVMPSGRRRVALLLAPAIAVQAVGESVGVLFGARGASAKLTDIELNRRAYLSAPDAKTVSQP